MRRLLPLAAAAWIVACSGPRPEVRSVRVAPGARGTFLVTVELENDGRGEGQVSVDVTLRDRATRRVVGRDEIPVDLHPRERVDVSRTIEAPGAADVTAEAEARYPPP